MLIDRFNETVKKCEEEAREKGLKPLLISAEESYRVYEQINAEMRQFNIDFKRKNFESELDARNFLIY